PAERAADPVRDFARTLEAATVPIDAAIDKLPMLAVGVLSPAARGERKETLVHAVTQGGGPVVVAPHAGRPLVFQLVSPRLNSGEYWEPVALERRGDELLLRIESWRDDWGR